MHKKTKIVFVINNFSVGGVEKLLFDIIYYLDKEKFDIRIVTVFGSGPLEASFRDLGIPIYFVGISESFRKKLPRDFIWTIPTFFIILRVAFLFIKSKPDVVVSSLFQADVMGIIAAKLVRIKKRIIIQHDVVRFQEFVYMVKRDFSIEFATNIVAVSETVKKFLVEYFKADSNKVLTILNGVDFNKFKSAGRVLPEVGAPVIGVIGRLEEIKGQIYLLEALKILKKKNGLNPHVLIGGEGEKRAVLEKYVFENGLLGVEFLGAIEDVPGFLSKIDILVVPSESEGFGLVVLEGMVSGKVVIASDIEVMHELIKDGHNGLLFKSKNPESLAGVLTQVLNNKEMCVRLQEGALSHIKQNEKIFNISEVAKTYQQLFLAK